MVSRPSTARPRLVETGSLVTGLPEALLHDLAVSPLAWITVVSPPGSSRYVRVRCRDEELRVEVASNRLLGAGDRLSRSEESVLEDLGLAAPEAGGPGCHWWWTGTGPEACLRAAWLVAEVAFEVFDVTLGSSLRLERCSTLPPVHST